MSNPPPSPARTTTTLYSYVEKLAKEQAPRAAPLLLGLRWSFGVPPSGLDGLTEYSLPSGPTPLPRLLEQRGGLRIVRHEGDSPMSLEDHLTSGRSAIVAVDAFYFPFRPAYRRVHSSRTVLVRRDLTEGRFHVSDSWGPPAEGTVSGEELENARFSEVPRDLDREPLFSGEPVRGVWFSVEVEPLQVEDARAWARERLGWLYDEMATPEEHGIAALRRFCRWLEGVLVESGAAPESIAIRRGASLLLRPELSSRLYLGAFLRNAAHLVEDEELRTVVDLYRQRLGHLQAAMDTLTKTIRTRRPEYDGFIREQLALTCRNEEDLLLVLSRYGSGAVAAAS